MKIGTVTGTEIRKNRDGTQNTVMLQVEMDDADDVQSVELMPHAGMDYRPRSGTKVFIVESGAAYKLAIASKDAIEPSSAVGEQKVYSVDAGGLVAAIVHWMEDGQLVLNMGAGTAVEFKRLKTAFDQLKSDFDNHVHLAGLPLGSVVDSIAGPCTGTTAPPSAASIADIDPAESPTVNVP
jgi:hypothetical protein